MANGLFKVAERVYQLRGFDISNMTVLEGDSGADPDRSADHRRGLARGAGALLRASAEQAGRRGDLHPQPHRPLRRRARRGRRGRRQGGQGQGDRAGRLHGGDRRRERAGRPADVRGARSSSSAPCCRAARAARSMPGWARAMARGTPGLIAPTMSIEQAIETHAIDGIEIVFQLAPETEAPAEMHMFYPQLGVLNMAENACPLLHNFIPLRGAVARDPRIWAKYIGDAIAMYGAAHRGADRPASLADLGPRRGARPARGAARSLQAHPRPDPALHEQGLAAGRDRRGRSTCRRASPSAGRCAATTARSATT